MMARRSTGGSSSIFKSWSDRHNWRGTGVWVFLEVQGALWPGRGSVAPATRPFAGGKGAGLCDFPSDGNPQCESGFQALTEIQYHHIQVFRRDAFLEATLQHGVEKGILIIKPAVMQCWRPQCPPPHISEPHSKL